MHAELPRTGPGSVDSHPTGSTWQVPPSWETVGPSSVDDHAAAGSDDEADMVKKERRQTTNPAKLAARHRPYQLRFYRADATFHFVSITVRGTVAQLAPQLDLSLGIGRKEPHRLYIRERGRGL
jgi:hypothetical protein